MAFWWTVAVEALIESNWCRKFVENYTCRKSFKKVYPKKHTFFIKSEPYLSFRYSFPDLQLVALWCRFVYLLIVAFWGKHVCHSGKKHAWSLLINIFIVLAVHSKLLLRFLASNLSNLIIFRNFPIICVFIWSNACEISDKCNNIKLSMSLIHYLMMKMLLVIN